jgi:hypothetical protein
MIPKTIHYCWFGRNPIPELELKCIKSWSKHFPDHKIQMWNEDNFDINEAVFVKQAYETKHYAFVSDYVRAKVLYEYGGIYLDTDVEILQSFESLLKEKDCFLGFETRTKLGTAVMGFTPKHDVLQSFLHYYNKNSFISRNGDVNTIANVTVLTDILTRRGLLADGSAQNIDNIEVFTREFFYPKKISQDEFQISKQTVAVHRCSNSWMTDRERKRGSNILWIKIMRPVLRFYRGIGLKIFGSKNIKNLEIMLRNRLK